MDPSLSLQGNNLNGRESARIAASATFRKSESFLAMRRTQGAIPFTPLGRIAAPQHIGDREAIDRSKTMSFLNQLFPRRQSRHDREMAYLNGAVSLYDLECREREIAQGKFARY
jgi:hypothetical protein